MENKQQLKLFNGAFLIFLYLFEIVEISCNSESQETWQVSDDILLVNFSCLLRLTVHTDTVYTLQVTTTYQN